ncbi:MAG: hypothetical protein M1834_007467 [Cirrosporium novae-zelandiae]|nr:MAG: hypothetical protein M1834_007467 [Cirrosporium novae-zelandiae]
MDAEKQPHYEENLSSEDSSSTIETTSTLSADDTMEPASTKNSLSPAVYVALWMILSSAVIIYNKWILDDAGFPYPITLTTWHLGFATLATRILARTTSLLDGRKKIKMDARIYFRAIAPIGLFYSFSLICGNLTYLYLSVAFIQMLKAATPVVVLLVSWAFGVLRPDMNKFLIVCIIVAGVFVASIGEVKFNTTGFLYQCGGIVFEATRLVMVQRLLSPTKYKMDPLVSLYYFAPVCTAMNILFAIPLEGGEIHMRLVRRVGLCHFVGNAFVAFALNVASVLLYYLVKRIAADDLGDWQNIILSPDIIGHPESGPPCSCICDDLGNSRILLANDGLRGGTCWPLLISDGIG